MRKIKREFLVEALVALAMVVAAAVMWLLVSNEEAGDIPSQEYNIDSLRQVHKALRDTVSFYEDGM